MKRKLSLILLTAVLVMVAIVPIFAFTAAAAEESATITFDDKAKRSIYSTTQQVWVENGITFTNDKASSSTNVGDYSSPVRLYAKSKVTIAVAEGNTISKIEVTCGNSSYATALANSITSGGTASTSGSVVTITPDAQASSFVIASLSAQSRVNSITVTYETTGSASDCEHANTTTTTVDATCTEAGSVTVVCDDCGETVSTDTTDALGHEKDEGVVTTEPGKGTDGVKTYTCTVCGEEFTEVIPALGWTATFVVPEGADTPTIDDTLTALMPEGPDAPESFNMHAYEFAGWAKTAIDGEVTEKPELYKAGETVALTADTTFYAVYTWSVGGSSSGTNDYKLTDIADISATDVVVIVWNTSEGSFAPTNNNGTSKAPAATAVTIDGNMLTGDIADTIKWNIVNNNGNLTIYVNGTTDTWLYCTSSNNGVRVGTNANKVFTIDSASGYLKNTATSRYLGVYLTTPDVRCYTNTTGNTANQTLSFYVLQSSGGLDYYVTTLGKLDTTCQHESEKLTTDHKDATCTTDGYTIVTCSCGAIISEETIEALDHNYVDEETKAPSCTETGVTTYTCTTCGDTYTEDIDMLDHNYVDNICADCGKVDPSSITLAGRYYIAAIRSSGNYWYMTSDLGTAGTKRYQAVDSGLTTLPTEITAPETGYVFVFEKNDDGTYSIYAEGVDGDNYLGWTSGNSGALVAKDQALALTVELQEDETYLVYFGERYLSLNGTTNNNYFAWYAGTQKQDLTLIPVNEAEEEETSKITSASITIGTNLSLNYYVTLAEGENIADYAMRFTMNGVATTVTEGVYNETLGQYVFTFTGIAPQCMGDNITAELMKAGEVVNTKDNYSVRQNAINLMNEEGATNALKTLLVDMLNYGAKAQLYKNYNTDALVNAGYETASNATPSEVDNAKEVKYSKNAAYNIKALGVRFDYDNKLYVRFIAESTEDLVVKIGGTEAAIEADGNGNYIAYSEGISALGFANVCTFELILGGETIQTAEYSVNSYAYSMQNNATMSDLALALYNYGKSAVAYAENN